MGNARWTGVPLRDLLDRSGVKAGAVEVGFEDWIVRRLSPRRVLPRLWESIMPGTAR